MYIFSSRKAVAYSCDELNISEIFFVVRFIATGCLVERNIVMCHVRVIGHEIIDKTGFLC